MPRRRSRVLEALARTVLRMLAVAGLLAMLPSLPALPRGAKGSPEARAAAAPLAPEVECGGAPHCGVAVAESLRASR